MAPRVITGGPFFIAEIPIEAIGSETERLRRGKQARLDDFLEKDHGIFGIPAITAGWRDYHGFLVDPSDPKNPTDPGFLKLSNSNRRDQDPESQDKVRVQRFYFIA